MAATQLAAQSLVGLTALHCPKMQALLLLCVQATITPKTSQMGPMSSTAEDWGEAAGPLGTAGYVWVQIFQFYIGFVTRS